MNRSYFLDIDGEVQQQLSFVATESARDEEQHVKSRLADMSEDQRERYFDALEAEPLEPIFIDDFCEG